MMAACCYTMSGVGYRGKPEEGFSFGLELVLEWLQPYSSLPPITFESP